MSGSFEDFSVVDDWGPEKIVCVSDARTGMRGVLVIDNTARGIGKGGTRMSPSVSVPEIARLARVMTWKWAGVDLFFGGAKAGIRADPTQANKESVLRAFARALANEVPHEYVFGLDMGLTEADAAVIQDELGTRSAVVGTPDVIGGVPYDEWGVTGFGVAEAADAALELDGAGLSGARVIVQGFGAVGVAAAERCTELGATVIGVSTSCGGLYDPDGVDIRALVDARSVHGDACVEQAGGTSRLSAPEALLDRDCDVLIPAATQDVIDASLAERLSCRLIVEGANLPTTPDAQRVLAARGISVVPDLIANAGGVVAAAYAMDARHSAFVPDRSTILEAIASKLRVNTGLVLTESQRSDVTTHEAARRIAAARVSAAMQAKRRLREPNVS